jgi:hypothetical protein
MTSTSVPLTGDDVRRITFGHILKTTDIRRFPV